MKTILVFPPVWESSTPYSSLAVLSAFLKANKVETDIMDLNIETQYLILTDPSYIRNTIKTLEKHREQYSDPLRLDSINLALNLYKQFYSIFNKNIVDRIQNADNQKEEMRYKIITNYLRFIVSTPYYPTVFSELSYTTKRELNSVKNIIDEVESEERNIFLSIYEKYFLDEFLKYDIVGISIASTNQLVPGFTLAKLLKRKKPGIKIIVGGAVLPYLENHIKCNYDLFRYGDFFIIGEGETALLKCIRYLHGEGNLNDIPNTLYWNGKNVVSNKMNIIEDVNQLPIPDYSEYPLKKYFTRKIALPYLASRGCYWNKCSFCSLTCSYGNKYRQRDNAKIEEDLIFLSENYKFDRLVFNDEALTARRIGEVADIIEKNKINLKWNCLARLNNNYNDEILTKAKRSGLLMLSLGLESGSQRTLDKMNKGINVKEVPYIIKQLKKHRIWVNLYFIIGFPTETEEDFIESLNFIKDNEHYIDSLSYTLFRLESNSKIFISPKDYDVVQIKEKENIDFFGPDYQYETNVYQQYELNSRYNRLYNTIDQKVYNPNNIYFDFDSIFSFLCEDKQEELFKEIYLNVKHKEEIDLISINSFEGYLLSINNQTVIFKGSETYMILNRSSCEMYSFNPTAIFMLKKIESGIKKCKDIIYELQIEYNISEEVLNRDIIIVIKKMLYLDVLQYEKEV